MELQTETATESAGVAFDAQTRLSFYKRMLRIRMVEEAIADRYAEQEMRCPVHLSIGQEAVAVGVCSALAPHDYILSTHRGHAHYLAKGGSLNALLAEIYGRATGCASGKGGSMHLVDLSVNVLGTTPIVGSSLPVAVGAAFATWMNHRDNVTAVFFGEGATEEGVFAESINFAALKKLPVIFVCENNFYSVYSPLSVRQPAARSRTGIAEAHGITAMSGNGNDVEEVYRITTTAVEEIRSGRGPVYLEFETYRFREHCGPNYDNNIGYRTEEEFLTWRERCPIETYERRLAAELNVPASELGTIRTALENEINGAFAFAKSSPWPDISQALADVYAEERP